MKDKNFVIAYDAGSFGTGDMIRTKKKDLLYIRTLTDALSELPTIEEDLEKLVRLKHKWVMFYEQIIIEL